MAKKALRFDEILEATSEISYEQLRQLLVQYEKTHDVDLYKEEGRLIHSDFDARLKKLNINSTCPGCNSSIVVKNGKKNGIQTYKCTECGRRFNRFTGTFLEKTRLHYEVWLKLVFLTVNEFSIKEIRTVLEKDYHLEGLTDRTILLWRDKILHAMASVEPPELSGVIQIDETFVREAQKGSKCLKSTFKLNQERLPRYGRVASSMGVMGPEFANVVCAIDDKNHCVCKVACLGKIEIELFTTLFDKYIKSPVFICTDRNKMYRKYCEARSYQHYERPSTYVQTLKEMGYKNPSEDGYDKAKNEQILRTIFKEKTGDTIYYYKGICSGYDSFKEIKEKYQLSLARVNGLHSEIKAYIYINMKNVSTKNLQDYIGAFQYKKNWSTDHKHYPSSMADAELILMELIATRSNFTIADMKERKLEFTQPSMQYEKILIEKTRIARETLKNEFFKFNPEDGVTTFQTKKYLYDQSQTRLFEFAKKYDRPVKKKDAVTKLIDEIMKIPNLEDVIYEMLGSDREHRIDDDDIEALGAGCYRVQRLKQYAK